MNTVFKLLSECHQKIRECENEIISTGDDYNIFSLLGLTSKELTHSKIIASLLDPDGRHHMGPIFLDAFIEVIGIDKGRFDSAHSSVKTEEPLGKIINDSACPNGGRIDVILTDRNGQKIIIENKIFAQDQHKQLLRYSQHKSQGIPILYLTPTGKMPAKISYCADGIALNKGGDFICISYEHHIIKWLEKSMEFYLPDNIKSVILQYYNIVKKIVNLSKRNQMENDIVDIIVKDKSECGYLDTAFEISSLIEKIQIKAQSDFWKEIKKSLEDRDIKPEFTLDFIGTQARKDSDDAIENCVSKYIIKGAAEYRYFGYDVKVGAYEKHDVFLKVCVNENLLFYVHFREIGEHRTKFLNKLKESEDISRQWKFVDDEMRIMWRRPEINGNKDVQYKMIDFGKTVRPSEYKVEQIISDFIKAKNQISEWCSNNKQI